MKGVSFDQKSQKYRAYISVGCERFYFGFFATEQEAEDKRREAEEKYFDDKCMLNLNSLYTNTQLLHLYIMFIRLKQLGRYKYSFRRFVFNNHKHNIEVLGCEFAPTSQLGDAGRLALNYLINGNSLDAISRTLNVTRYELIKLLNPVFGDKAENLYD